MGKASRKKCESQDIPTLKLPESLKKLNLKIEHRKSKPGEQKISARLATLLTGIVPPDSSLKTYQSALNALVYAWNLSRLDKTERDDVLNKDIPNIIENFETRGAIDLLISQKLAIFPDDKRLIASCSVEFEDDALYVKAMTLEKPSPSNLTA